MKNDLICNILPRKHSLQNKDHIFDEAQYNFYLRKYRDLCTSKNLTNYIKHRKFDDFFPSSFWNFRR